MPKDFIDATLEMTGKINEGQRLLMELMNPQIKSLFEIIFYPYIDLNPIPKKTPFAHATKGISVTETLAQLGTHIIAENAMAKLHLQTLVIPSETFEYEPTMYGKIIKGLIHPDSVTMTFYETDTGIVRNYINLIKGQIYQREPDGSVVFEDKQHLAKRNACVMLQSGLGTPVFGIYQLIGLSLQNPGELTVGHGESDIMTIDVTFAVDRVDSKPFL